MAARIGRREQHAERLFQQGNASLPTLGDVPAGIFRQATADVSRQANSPVIADSIYPEEADAIAYAVGAQKLGQLAEGAALFSTKDWKAVGLSANAFYVGPLFTDMGNTYYVYRFSSADPKTNGYTLTRGSYTPGRNETDLVGSLAKVQGKTSLHVTTSGLSPVPSTDSPAPGVRAPAGPKAPGTKPGNEPVVQGGAVRWANPPTS